MSTIVIDRFPERKIKEIINRIDESALTQTQQEVIMNFNAYPKIDFDNAEKIATLVGVGIDELMATREISTKTLNYRNKINDESLPKISKIIELMNKIDNQYVISGE